MLLSNNAKYVLPLLLLVGHLASPCSSSQQLLRTTRTHHAARRLNGASPHARPDSATTNEDHAVTIDVLANDADPGGEPLQVTSVTQASNGKVVNDLDGTVTYIPNRDFNGVDTFKYGVSDGMFSSEATVTVTVLPINDVPVAVDCNATTDEGMPVTVDVLSKYTDPEGDPLEISSSGQAVHGTVMDNFDGTLTYIPNANFNGLDIFRYRVSDGQGTTDIAKVMVSVRRLVTEPQLDVGMMGDPHVKTWAGTWFDYHGECDLVLLQVSNFDGNGQDLSIHVRTTMRYQYSYIESAALQIGDDILEVSSFGDYAVNGVDTPKLGLRNAALAGYNVHHTQPEEKKHFFNIVLGPNENITLSSYKDLVAVSINAGKESAKYFRSSVGMMGSYSGSMLARDGETAVKDMNAFGQEWQVTNEEPMLFRTIRAPQYPSKCILPSPVAADRPHLGEVVSRNKAEVACGHLTGKVFENCVSDVMATGDIELAE